MKSSYFLGALAAGALIVSAPLAEAQERVQWRAQSAYPAALPQLGPILPTVSERVERATGGNFRIRAMEPGAMVPMLESWDAISAGSLDAGFASLGFWPGREPGASFFSAVPFGPDFGEYTAWMYEGGGVELMDEIMAEHNMKMLICGTLSPEGAGWFREEITSVEDLEGLRMRIFGLGGAVMEKLGVSTQLLAPGDIYAALDRGALDATEFSMPSLDLHFGFHEVANNYYFPGWHQMVTLMQLMINLDRWNELSDENQAILEYACHDITVRTLAEAEANQGPALRELQDEHGVALREWPEEILDAYREAWGEVVEDYKAQDETFARVWESYSEFREEYALWRELGYIN